MRLVIIESPFAGDVARNQKYLRASMHDCLMRGEAPYASHGLYTQEGVLDDTIQGEREIGILAGFAFRHACHATVVYADLGISNGMERGIAHAHRILHTIEYRSLGQWEGSRDETTSI